MFIQPRPTLTSGPVYGQALYHRQTIQHATPTLKQQLTQFYQNWQKEYYPAIEQIKETYGWYTDLPISEKNDIAILAEWYEFIVKTGLENTILRSINTNETKLKTLEDFETQIRTFIRANCQLRA